jgi:hypothetical protein
MKHAHLHGKCCDMALIEKEATSMAQSGALRCRSRLGGMLNYYYREAA